MGIWGKMAETRDNTKQAQVIDDNLKRVYQDMLDEGVPDRFMELLDQLKQQDSEEAGQDDSAALSGQNESSR